MFRSLLLASCLCAPFAAGASAWAQSADPIGDALIQPLRDLNIVRRETPEAVQRAAADPYSEGSTHASGALDCASAATEIEALTLALGDDIDVRTQSLSLMAQAQIGAGNAIVDAVGDVVELPYRSIIRRLSGAERHDRALRSATQAALLRRAFLRGLTARECDTPQLMAAFEYKPEPPLSDLDLARLQLAAANAAALAAVDHWTPHAEPAPVDLTFTSETGLADLELARVQLAAANAAAASAQQEWFQHAAFMPDDVLAAAPTVMQLEELARARAQLAAANAAAAAAAEPQWTPPPESTPDDTAAETRISDLELARQQLAAANAAATSPQTWPRPYTE